MAAVFAALMCCLRAGGRIVASRALFGSCHHIVANILPRYGVESVFVDGTDLAQWEAALAEDTACVFPETPSNPALEIIDLEAVAALAHDAGARLVVDSVFATPILQKPMTLGADIVVYSTTKHIDGQGRALGGAILTDDNTWYDDHLEPFMRHTGPALSPFNAWVLVKGLETLDLRVRQQGRNAAAVADFLEADNRVARVLYPGLSSHPQHDLAMAQMDGGGTVVSFEVPGGRDGAFAVLDGLRLVDISNNLGDAKSLATHPATTTHQRLSPQERTTIGISDDLVRLSVGLEDVEDLMEDLDQALQRGDGS